MQVKQVHLKNFRNLNDVDINFSCDNKIAKKIILIGENAQGKSNFLEAIELASIGKSSRASAELDLIGWSKEGLALEVVFERDQRDESVSLFYSKTNIGNRSITKKIKVNDVSQTSIKSLLGHLVTVSFKSQDLNLLRGGPKYRREWIDNVILRIRPTFHDVMNNYQKVIVQRNKLLKMLFEKGGRVAVSDQDQLIAWDKQLARFGAQIIKERVNLITALLPKAQESQSFLSGKREVLSANYLLQAPEPREVEDQIDSEEPDSMPISDLNQADVKEIAILLFRLLKERRREEIVRKQSLIGPHRDDVVLNLNDVSAVDFASQGQQRSLVLSLKLAELDLIRNALEESPILLLDDVLAELDAGRQGLLLSAVNTFSQTIITTTHLAGFDNQWLNDSNIYMVKAGEISPAVPA